MKENIKIIEEYTGNISLAACSLKRALEALRTVFSDDYTELLNGTQEEAYTKMWDWFADKYELIGGMIEISCIAAADIINITSHIERTCIE